MSIDTITTNLESEAFPIEVKAITANSYNSRYTTTIEIEGETHTWYSLKGGVEPSKAAINNHNISYEIFFDPTDQKWLKIVPPEKHRPEGLESRLKRSIVLSKTALSIARVDPSLIDSLREVYVDIRGKTVFGFLSSHLGPTLEYLLKNGALTNSKAEFLSAAYTIAFKQAVKLYLDYGYWMSDPNPGNIVITTNKENSTKIALIDFSNDSQIKWDKTKEISESDRIRKNTRDIEQLYRQFKKHCKLYRLTLPPLEDLID